MKKSIGSIRVYYTQTTTKQQTRIAYTIYCCAAFAITTRSMCIYICVHWGIRFSSGNVFK